MTPLLYVLAGAALGGVIGWLIGSRHSSAPTDNRLEGELRQQLSQRETELAQSREQITQTKTSLATAQANQIAAEKLLAEQRTLHDRALSEAKIAQEKALADL